QDDPGVDWEMVSIIVGVTNLLLVLILGGAFIFIRKRQNQVFILDDEFNIEGDAGDINV
ncbi:MAG: hypothetical protein ACI8XC_002383, partial [Gammaproteobacteria bacterium]